MEKKYKKRIIFIKENKGKKLTIERRYLPEIIHDDGWQISNFDELQKFKSLIKKTIRYCVLF